LVVPLLFVPHIVEESRSTIRMRTSKELEEVAVDVAFLAQRLRTALIEILCDETSDGWLHVLCKYMSKLLNLDLDVAQCADISAQIVAFCLFAARIQIPRNKQLTRALAIAWFSDTIPHVRGILASIAQAGLCDHLTAPIDELINLINRGARDEMWQAIATYTRSEDALMHWYEHFLAAFDPRRRSARGVYYTPAPVVSYIVSSVDALLKRDFAVVQGLADTTAITANIASEDGQHLLEIPRISVLDPAVGTGAFLHGVIDRLSASLSGDSQYWSDAVTQHPLPRLTGFELLPTTYLVAQVNVQTHLARLGYDLGSFTQIGLHRANTLAQCFDSTRFPLSHMLTGDRTSCDTGDTDGPIMAIIGNPPYAGHSTNNGAYITQLLHNALGNYFSVDGLPLLEHNSKWLNDDYVKFIRFAQEYVQRVGRGIVAFVTNHGYLDNPTFRGMRRSLMQSFDELYLLDLHGNSKKNERAPDGSKDENVFDIRQGVVIGIFVKRLQYSGVNTHAVVHHTDLWGPREVYEGTGQQDLSGGKFPWLAAHDVTTTQWERLEPTAPLYLFVPCDNRLRAEYERGWRIDQIMETFSLGVLTKRDALVIGFDHAEVHRNLQTFVDSSLTDSECAAQFGLPMRDKDRWDLAKARAAISHDLDAEQITGIAYRPFDVRAIYYDGRLVARMNTRVMQHFKQANPALVLGRQGAATGAGTWDVAFVTTILPDQNFFRRGGGTVFPLYLYPDAYEHSDAYGHEAARPNALQASSPLCRPNLSSAFIEAFSYHLNLHYITIDKGDLRETFGPQDVFNYIYAVFFSPHYRTRYASFLKSDFPRLPLPSHSSQFSALCQLGERLVALHGMEQCGEVRSVFPIAGNNEVEYVTFVEALSSHSAKQACNGRVYINREQYFADVPRQVWAFHIGGYPVIRKWLHDRKGRVLSPPAIQHVQRVIAALAATVEIMKEIDSFVTLTSC
jgi:predicted helicase